MIHDPHHTDLVETTGTIAIGHTAIVCGRGNGFR